MRERFQNPSLDHRLSDIARNHDEKKLRRFQPVIDLAHELGLNVRQPRLTAALRANSGDIAAAILERALSEIGPLD